MSTNIIYTIYILYVQRYDFWVCPKLGQTSEPQVVAFFIGPWGTPRTPWNEWIWCTPPFLTNSVFGGLKVLAVLCCLVMLLNLVVIFPHLMIIVSIRKNIQFTRGLPAWHVFSRLLRKTVAQTWVFLLFVSCLLVPLLLLFPSAGYHGQSLGFVSHGFQKGRRAKRQWCQSGWGP